MTAGAVQRHELRNVEGAPWGDVGNSTLRWCSYHGQQYLFKEYSFEFRVDVNNHALGELIAWRAKLSPDDRERLDRVAAWPRFQVHDDGVVIGVLVPAAPRQFYAGSHSGGWRPRSMEYLIRYDTGEGEASGASVRDKRRAVGNATAELLWFHRRQVRVNDLRESNILCTADGTAVYYVDCDVMMGPWGVVSPGAAPEYLAAVLPHQPDPFEQPSREMELARVAWLATFILLDDFRLREVPAQRLAEHISAADADLLRRTARMHAINIEDWRELARRWSEAPWFGSAQVPTGARAGPEGPDRFGEAEEEPPMTFSAGRRLPRTRVMRSNGDGRRQHHWLPDGLRLPLPEHVPFRSYLEPDSVTRAELSRRSPRRFVLVTFAAVLLVFGLIAAFALGSGA